MSSTPSVRVPTLATLCDQAASFPQHALLLFDARLERPGPNGEEPGLSAHGFAQLAASFCGIRIADPAQNDFWEIAAGHPDVFVADRARAQLRREELERLFVLAPYPPAQGGRRLFFIDRCERLTPAAANTLLKVLEEPVVPTLFLLTASRRAEVLPTILSRCQRLSVRLREDAASGNSATGNTGTGNTASANTPSGNATADYAHSSSALPSDPESVAPLSALRQHLLAAAERAGAEDEPVPRLSESAPPPPSRVAEMLDCAEELGRLHDGETLRGVVVSLVAEMCQKGAMAQSLARFILREVRAWKDVEPYHPKSALWLLRILMLAA